MNKLWLLCMPFLSPDLSAQGLELFTGAGIHLTKGNYQISASIGEPWIGTVEGNSFLVTEGFHQGIRSEQLPSTLTERALEPESWNVSLAPNPATSYVQIKIQENPGKNHVVRLFDALGKMLYEIETATTIQRLELGWLEPGPYWISIYAPENGQSRTLPFAKINL